MAATITSPLRKFILDEIKGRKDSNGDKFYAAIGRSQEWNATDVSPTPNGSYHEERDFRNNMQSVKLITDASFVIPRYNWSSGTFYDAYDDQSTGNSSAYYVINSNQQVYMVLRKSISNTGVAIASTVEPTGNTTGTPFKTSDGYVWKMVYSISSASANKFQSANFIPVELVKGQNDSADISVGDSGSYSADQLAQAVIQKNAVDGQIVGYAIDNPGSGYNSAPTLTITGNGTNAKAVATISGGAVVKVTTDSDSAGGIGISTTNFGTGYDFASVAVSGGSPDSAAIIRPIISTANGGFGKDPVKDLRSNALMFNAKPSGAERADFFINQQFRQVGLLKNPTKPDGTAFDSSTGNALTVLNFATVSTPFEKDQVITGGTSGAKAIIDFDSTGSTGVSGGALFIHQTDSNGFTSFTTGETITASGGSTGVLLGSSRHDSSPEVDPQSGELLYIDNRSAITRASGQTEDLKIVIQV